MNIQRINLICMCTRLCARATIVYIDPLIGGALITGGAGLLGSIFGGLFGSSSSKKNADIAAESQRETNAANIQMQRETNAVNRQIAEDVNETNRDLAYQQNQWNIEQWNRENEYNSPANQVALYRAAGLNPAMVGGNFIPANSVQSAPLANQQIYSELSPQIQDPERYALSSRQQGTLAQLEMMKNATDSIKNIVSDYYSIKKTEQDIEESKSRSALNWDLIKNVNPAQVKLWSENQRYLHGKNWLQEQINPELAKQASIETDLLDVRLKIAHKDLSIKDDYKSYLRALKEGQDNQNQLLKIAIKYAPQLTRAQIRSLESQAYRNYLEGDEVKYLLDYRKNNGGYTPEMDLTVALGLQNLEGTKYSADKHLEGTKYSSDNTNKYSPIRWVGSAIGAIGGAAAVWKVWKIGKFAGNRIGGALTLPMFQEYVDNILFPYSKGSKFDYGTNFEQ